jgi:hypothetical protein
VCIVSPTGYRVEGLSPSDAATLYTLLETGKLHRVDPAAYLLASVRAADAGDVLLPADFAR